ncbi:hypothetical protein [Alkalicoccobacillus porphyridii]|uniref:Uncharacterized protein n=1 Tax=Alkalicoccobacillus porphyridii TaxID=2597270 RepID=A0A554A126_9BACI|nr:hypothetical protein [Alkalicoccobacillus porphyridii]TSB47394.1 hypothetical protein FN960_06560 [Alkalicoccobacillus porphyridii]
MKNYKLAIIVLVLLITLILIIIGRIGYYVYDHVRIVMFEQVVEDQDWDVNEVEVTIVDGLGIDPIAKIEEEDIMQRLMNEPADMELRKMRERVGADWLYRLNIRGGNYSGDVEVAEEYIGFRHEVYRVQNHNRLLEVIEELEEEGALEWKEYE